MPSGLKSTSSPITISQSVQQGVANTFGVEAIDLQLNPLDNEVFVVTGVKIDFLVLPKPDVSLGTLNQQSPVFEVSVHKTRPAARGDIGGSSVIASSRLMSFAQLDPTNSIITNAFVENNAMDVPPAAMDYLDIIATNNYFISVYSEQSPTNKVAAAVRLYGFRARADSNTYAALVQSELLSA